MSGQQAALVIAVALVVGAAFVGVTWLSTGDEVTSGPAPSAADEAEPPPADDKPSLTPSEVDQPLTDPLVVALVSELRQTTLPKLEAKALIAPHARDPSATIVAGAVTQRVLGDDPERVLTALFPCRQDCKGVERGALSLATLCPGGTRWLDDPGRKLARFEACQTDDLLVVRPDGPTGAVVLIREQGLPAIFRELVTALAAPGAGLDDDGLDAKALRAAVSAGTEDKRVGQRLTAQLTQPLEGKDRRGDAFVLTPVVADDEQTGGAAGLCGATLVVSPGYKMSRQAWPRRYFIDAAVLYTHEKLPKGSFRLASGRDLKLTLEVRAAGCR